LFRFLYDNVPDWHKEKALRAYESYFKEEAQALDREKLIEVTDKIMPDKVHEGIKDRINEEIEKFTRYQDMKKKRK